MKFLSQAPIPVIVVAPVVFIVLFSEDLTWQFRYTENSYRVRSPMVHCYHFRAILHKLENNEVSKILG